MVELKVKYSDTITNLSSSDYGFMLRLWIVLSESGVLNKDIVERNDEYNIVLGELLELDRLKTILNDQFNSSYISLSLE